MLCRAAIKQIRQIGGQARTRSVWNSAINCAVKSKKVYPRVSDSKFRPWMTAGHKNWPWTCAVPVRFFAIHTEITEAEYHSMASAVLDAILDRLEVLEDESPGMEVESSGDGVVTVKVRGKGTWVLNKQTPSRQLWLSSPISGPWHF
eukprot:CAMPEP_0172182114 /NCGR_PEP_ID=MMETSP1050-20130122/18211_1 /TAXON_ID=233186 /ORGANISM="Cryptomonas curvata, Strain CCAP979/52" /LENGTH=146 /DNA_ID=CAMNT_0012855507 /DNA_START=6 /DNA_END=443 /DNA_ORIENTATION=-